jgi:uncharacterized membrane protein YedE/YeeE
MMNDLKENKTDTYWNPYVAGVLLGLTLLTSFVVLGAGLGASAGIARFAAVVKGCCFPIVGDAYFGRFGQSPMAYYLVFMFVGVFLGGLFSAVTSNRVVLSMERGRDVTPKSRAAYALGGGILVGFASRLAGGCTSGQALSGGSLLLTGSLLFMIFCFAGGYGFAWFVRRQWYV